MKDKDVIESWLKLYNRLNKTTYKVVEWPDVKDRVNKAVDALCEDDLGNRMAVEHTLIQPFTGEKADTPRFLETLASLEKDPRLVMPGFTIHASQSVACVPSGVQWSKVRTQLLNELVRILPALPVGGTKVDITVGSIVLPLTILKHALLPGEQPSFTTARIWPGDPGPELVLAALKAKVPKLASYADAKKILLFEKDAIAGTIESQFEQLPANAEVESMLQQIDEIWAVNTVSLESDSVIFANDVWPTMGETICSLNLKTNELWQPHR